MTSTAYYGTPRPGLPDPPLIREQLFLLTHDEDHHLRPWIDANAVSIGLAGAAVIDLLAAAAPSTAPKHAAGSPSGGATQDPPPRLDPGAMHVLHHLTSVLPALLLQIGPGIYDPTFRGLGNGGYISTDRKWGRTHYGLTDTAPLNRIRGKVRQRVNDPDKPISLHVETLTALVWALNIPDCLILDVDRGDFHRLLDTITDRVGRLAGPLDPLGSVPAVAQAVRSAVEHLALAPL